MMEFTQWYTFNITEDYGDDTYNQIEPGVRGGGGWAMVQLI